MRVIGLSTGSVRVKTAQVVGRGPIRVLTTMASREWTDWLPINFWAIEHVEGTILVDVGESPRASEPGYFPAWHPYYRLAVRMDVKQGEGPADQLRGAGIDPDSVTKVILTHMHTDHIGGIADFPNATILATEREIHDFGTLRGKLIGGFLPGNAPEWLSPTAIAFDGESIGSFDKSASVTEDDTIVVVPTPGHTPGHCSVIVKESSGRTIFIAGDVTYTLNALESQSVDGVSPSRQKSKATLARVRDFVNETDAVYLPTHDPDAIGRLASVGRGKTAISQSADS